MIGGDKGRLTKYDLPANMVYRGWNAVAVSAAHGAHRMRQMQEAARAAGDYDAADNLRALAEDIEFSLSYVGVEYAPPND